MCSFKQVIEKTKTKKNQVEGLFNIYIFSLISREASKREDDWSFLKNKNKNKNRKGISHNFHAKIAGHLKSKIFSSKHRKHLDVFQNIFFEDILFAILKTGLEATWRAQRKLNWKINWNFIGNPPFLWINYISFIKRK